jgi:asparagine synthase (glutamine-hydrolysing)
MCSFDKSIWIVFNGEIYNYLELKKNLIKDGYHFETNSDTEVIINIYKKYGIRGFNKLNGMFAFAIFDEKNKSLILARDRFGIKPIYYYLNNNSLIFGSEIKSLYLSKMIQKSIDKSALNLFISFRYNPAPYTLMSNINKIIPGNYLVIRDKKIYSDSYIEESVETNKTISFDDAVENYIYLLENSVKRQMISDVPIASMLSGGIDSGIVSYFMQENSTKKIQTYTIGFYEDFHGNEIENAQRTAKIIKSNHKSILISKSRYYDVFGNIFKSLEEPNAITSSNILYLICEEISKYVKVALTGQGADEPLAGYTKYLGESILESYGNLLKIIPIDWMSRILRKNDYIERFGRMRKIKNKIDRFIELNKIYDDRSRKNLLKLNYYNENVDIEKRIFNNFNRDGEEDTLNQFLYIDTRTSLSDNLLLLADKLSMAHSLELRVPYLDNELISYVESLPSEYKIKRLNRKYIHKKSINKIFPNSMINQRKRGFETPFNNWLDENSRLILELYNNNKELHEIFNKEIINKIIDDQKIKKYDNTKKLIIILAFEFWYEYFYNSI